MSKRKPPSQRPEHRSSYTATKVAKPTTSNRTQMKVYARDRLPVGRDIGHWLPPVESKPRSGVIELERSKPVVSPLLDVPQEERERIARAVHRAVGTVDRAGRGGLCVYYALAGYAILQTLKRYEISIQCGSLGITPDPADPTLRFEINGESPGAAERGEFHAWLASPDGVWIDFSACEWPALVEASNDPSVRDQVAAIGGEVSAFGSFALVSEEMRYRQPRLGYYWSAWNVGPDFVRFSGSLELSRWLQRMIPLTPGAGELMDRAIMLYKRPDLEVFTANGPV